MDIASIYRNVIVSEINDLKEIIYFIHRVRISLYSTFGMETLSPTSLCSLRLEEILVGISLKNGIGKETATVFCHKLKIPDNRVTFPERKKLARPTCLSRI